MANGVLETGPLPKHSKYFLRKWVVTVPSYPSLKFYRASPSNFDVLIPILADPKNNELQGTRDKIWDETEITKCKKTVHSRYYEGNTTFQSLGVLIEYEGKAVGYGDVWPSKTHEGSATIGILLNEALRGQGIGKTAVSVLVQIAFDFDVPIMVGTMKANLPMRGVMASLGVLEEDEILSTLEWGVFAELVYRIKQQSWRYLDMNVEFSEQGHEQF